jgi:hypothetical protein
MAYKHVLSNNIVIYDIITSSKDAIVILREVYANGNETYVHCTHCMVLKYVLNYLFFQYCVFSEQGIISSWNECLVNV